MKIIKIGRLNFVWDWVEEVKWLSFFSGFFLCIGIVGLLLVVKEFMFNVSMVLFVSGIVGFFISSLLLNKVIDDNHVIDSKV